MATKLLFTKGHKQKTLNKIHSMKNHVNDGWKICEEFITNKDVLKAATLGELLSIQKKRLGLPQKVMVDKRLHKTLLSNMKKIIDQALYTDIEKNDSLPPELIDYLKEVRSLI